MKKSDAIQIFGNAARLARAIGISRSAVSKWSDVLSPAVADRVQAAAHREGIPFIKDPERVFTGHDASNREVEKGPGRAPGFIPPESRFESGKTFT